MKTAVVLTLVAGLAGGSTLRATASEAPALVQYTEHFGCYDPGGKTLKTTSKVKGTRAYSEHDDQKVYQDIRYDTDGYTLKVPNGTFHVELKFCEIQHDAVGQRIFGVKVQGQPVIARLDIFARVGKYTAYQLRSPDVIVTNGLLKIQFVRVVGSPCIAALSVGGDIAGAPNAVQRVFYQHINCGGGTYAGYEADFGCGNEPKTVQRTGASR
jgi:hypothetical protein